MRRLFWLLSMTGLTLAISVLAAATGPPNCSATIREHPNSPLLKRESHLVVGNKGEEVVDVTEAEPCGGDCWKFDHAEIEIYAQRFGAAQFVSLPPTGCTDCSAIRVRWYHEPTGHLSFAIRLFQRQLPHGCDQPPQTSELMQ